MLYLFSKRVRIFSKITLSNCCRFVGTCQHLLHPGLKDIYHFFVLEFPFFDGTTVLFHQCGINFLRASSSRLPSIQRHIFPKIPILSQTSLLGVFYVAGMDHQGLFFLP